MIGRAREAVRLARSREWEATRMYELISALASLQDTQSIAQTLANHTLDTFQLQRVDVLINSEKGSTPYTVIESRDPFHSNYNHRRLPH